MTARPTGIRKGLTAALSAIVLFLLCLIPTLFVPTAYAEKGGDSELLTLSNDGPIDLYYITDCLEGGQLCEQLRDNGYINNFELFYYDHNYYYNYFWDRFTNGVMAGEYSFRDAHVILDMRYGFTPENDGIDLRLTQFFSELKLHDCKTMFICGTDECRFSNDNGFLDYVDIHINTDRISNFIANVLERVEKACGKKKINECTFILDECFAPTDNGVFEGWFIRNYFLTYLKTIYIEEILLGGQTVLYICEQEDIRIAYHIGGDEYCDLFSNIVYNIHDSNFYADYLKDRYVCAIGGTWEGDSYLSEWWYTVNDVMRVENAIDFPVFIFNAVKFDFEANEFDLSGLGANLFLDVAAHNDDFFEIVVDFLADGDLTPYDNWPGRCVVTHKICYEGEEGWLLNMFDQWGLAQEWEPLLEVSIFASGWSVVMTEEEYEYFYGMDNVLG